MHMGTSWLGKTALIHPSHQACVQPLHSSRKRTSDGACIVVVDIGLTSSKNVYKNYVKCLPNLAINKSTYFRLRINSVAAWAFTLVQHRWEQISNISAWNPAQPDWLAAHFGISAENSFYVVTIHGTWVRSRRRLAVFKNK